MFLICKRVFSASSAFYFLILALFNSPYKESSSDSPNTSMFSTSFILFSLNSTISLLYLSKESTKFWKPILWSSIFENNCYLYSSKTIITSLRHSSTSLSTFCLFSSHLFLNSAKISFFATNVYVTSFGRYLLILLLWDSLGYFST